MPRASFYTLGCKLNFSETGTLERAFQQRGYEVVPFGEAADVAVINTCTVTEEADRKCRQVIRRALRANADAFVVVTGCYAQLKPDAIAGIEGVDAVLGTHEKLRLFELIGQFEKREQTQVDVSCIDAVTTFEPAYAAGERTRAFLKVQDGCDYTCSFCTIPLARGRSRSGHITATVREAVEIGQRGFREVVLSGVNIGLFGQERGETLLDLVRALDRVEGIERFRISSIEPNLCGDDLIDFVAASERFQPHFHLPLQSGDDRVLGKMRRRYRRRLYQERVGRILDRMPHAAVGVDVITGFPAEDDAAFANTVSFLEALPIAYLHVFTYSERARTAAVERPERMGGAGVPKPERSRRTRVLRLLSEKKRRAFYHTQLGQTRPVLWEAADRDGQMYGFTDNYVRVQRPHRADLAGRVEPARLSAVAEDGTLLATDPALVVL